MATNVDHFEAFIDELQQRSILSSDINYQAVPGHAIITISHFERNLEKFKAGDAYKKLLEEAEVTTPVN